jgi:hypothetical protein
MVVGMFNTPNHAEHAVQRFIPLGSLVTTTLGALQGVLSAA